ncbi:MAG: molecular chaperone DnaJ [Actinomycetota bacterium]|nr:molecular chaperone DnaJ [Actinomycetota bacterium]
MASTTRDYYKVLGVGRDATSEEIKKAFRRIARETHPDTNPGDARAETRFREAAEAYEVLSDGDRRAKYDRGDAIDLGDLLGGFGGLDDLLRSVFGEGGMFGRGAASRSTRGRDVLVRTEVSLHDAAFGGEATVMFNARSSCPECSGTGQEPGSDQTTCPDCAGAGQVRVSRRSLLGTMTSVATCPTCHGEGSLLTHPCHFCDGAGSVPDESSMTVEVPAGVSSGTRLRLSGRGESGGRFGPSGDLFVEVYVADDPRYERVDSDLIHRVSVGIAEAALGSRLEIPLIDGDVADLEIPSGTQPRSTFRMRGHGMTHLGRRTRGDLIVVVEVEIPSELSREEEDLLRRWAELRGEAIDRPAAT